MTSCTWVNDDVDDCPYGFWLNLHYKYNILDVDAANEYIKEVSVYVYDSAGAYVTRIDRTKEALVADNYRVKIEGLPDGKYQFVAWSGAGSKDYTLTGSQDSIAKFRLALTNQDVISTQMSNLYYGYLKPVMVGGDYAEQHIDMMKNTNQLACLVVSEAGDSELKPGDYSMKLVSANGTLDGYNNLVSDKKITYQPYSQDTVTVNDSNYGELHGIRFGISTLRLMSKTDSRLVVSDSKTNTQIFDISYPELVGTLGTLYTQLGRELSVQEYLDRQDFHTIIFFLQKNADGQVKVRVLSWRVRANDYLKL